MEMLANGGQINSVVHLKLTVFCINYISIFWKLKKNHFFGCTWSQLPHVGSSAVACRLFTATMWDPVP